MFQIGNGLRYLVCEACLDEIQSLHWKLSLETLDSLVYSMIPESALQTQKENCWQQRPTNQKAKSCDAKHGDFQSLG